MIKYFLFFLFLINLLISCKIKDEEGEAIARVYDTYLFEEDITKNIPADFTKEDSLLFRNNFIKTWATEQLLLHKAKINIASEDNDIEKLVASYKKELLIDKYLQAVLQQEVDTVISTDNIEEFYRNNKNIYKLNEELIQLKYIYFSKELTDKKEIIKQFKSRKDDDLGKLIDRELEFNSFNFNDSIWIALGDVLKKLPILKEKGKLKKNDFIQKEDSLGVYLVTIKDVLHRNQIAPKSYVVPTIKQMILHNRKLKLIKEIEKTLVKDAINDKQYEQYEDD